MATEIETPLTSDDCEAFEAKETTNTLPWGWLLLFFGLIAWGTWYAWAYSPATTGWTQAGEYQQSLEKK